MSGTHRREVLCLLVLTSSVPTLSPRRDVGTDNDIGTEQDKQGGWVTLGTVPKLHQTNVVIYYWLGLNVVRIRLKLPIKIKKRGRRFKLNNEQ